mmetsp:Transcript_4502/g.10849  ORF Transcript_4502/g.10849 Transcript_4502/m.10849 type:complete len:545 (-) Transcript_4502:89-1723(-)
MMRMGRQKDRMVGRYQLGDELGRGSSARVFKALNSETGEFVAVKQIPSSGMSKDQMSSLVSEVVLMKLLKHPNIVNYLESITTKDYLYIVLEFVENGSLASILKKFGSFTEQLVSIYIAQVLDGLTYLHEQGVIHRDIKGANVLVTRDGHVKLADFGVARLTDEQDKTQSVVGTPYWMAPETIEMSAFTTASDIWSVGCTVLELLTGVPPHFELTQMSAMYHIVNDAHPPLPEGLSDDLHDFLLRCFVKDVHLRARASELSAHPWLTSTLRSQLARCKDVSDLPEFMTHTVDHETSWLSSSEGTRGGPLEEGAPVVAGAPRRWMWPFHAGGSSARAQRQRPVALVDKQHRLAAASGTPLPGGAPPAVAVVCTNAERVSAVSPFNIDTDPPLCGFLWKRGTSALGKLSYYKRYFYLKDGALCYCSGRSDSTTHQLLEKKIPLASISSVDVSSVDRFEFNMRCDSRVYQFRSRTLRELDVWVISLRMQQQRHLGIFSERAMHAATEEAAAWKRSQLVSMVVLPTTRGGLSAVPVAGSALRRPTLLR